MTDAIAKRAGVELIEAGHPYPDVHSIAAADRALGIARGLEAQDHLLVLLSGGGSALLSAPAHGITLADKQATTRALLDSGATIAEINCVRKHLSRIKGGRLALAAGPARVTTLIISDVPGDDPSFVSSGPTVADHTSLEMAREILRKYGIPAPTAVLAALDNPANETPPADSLGLAGVETTVIARARDALCAAGRKAKDAGYVVMTGRFTSWNEAVLTSTAGEVSSETIAGTTDPFVAQLADVTDAIVEKRSPHVPLSEGAKTLRLALAAVRSGQEGRELRLAD